MKNIKIILFTLLALVIVLVAASCGEVTESISVSETDKFQSVYVLGQELNLSGGVLKAEGGGKTSEIPLDSDGVTVSGYDSNKLGKQTVCDPRIGVMLQKIVHGGNQDLLLAPRCVFFICRMGQK